MSANNYVRIKREYVPITGAVGEAHTTKFKIMDCDMESSYGSEIATESSLEEAIQKANAYMAENIVEYGLHIDPI